MSSTSSERVDNRLPVQEGKQSYAHTPGTCQYTANKRPRSNQAPVKNVPQTYLDLGHVSEHIFDYIHSVCFVFLYNTLCKLFW